MSRTHADNDKLGFRQLLIIHFLTNVLDKPSAEGKSRSVCTMPRRENVSFEETNVFNKLRAEGKSHSVCTMPRRENVCGEETNTNDTNSTINNLSD